MSKKHKLPNDVARCEGVYYDEWREGCENCLRRIAEIPEGDVPMIMPPDIIAFECEYLIEEESCRYN